MKRNRVLSYFWYPVFMGLAVALFSVLLTAGASLPLALYLPIVLIGCVVLVLEWLHPERLDWRPQWADVRLDSLFLALVQVLLPRVLVALPVLSVAASEVGSFDIGWPQHWPLAAQVLAMLLLVELGRYWVHRACHVWPPLWRLHEVHHSPDLLYALNTSRFHPLEKVLHFCVDTLPFVLIGVGPQVIAGYFLLYASNGFFQHSNIRLRYGFLNYLVGSAQTHRWHHARDPRIAMCNFGSSSVVWDLLFGTWYLPPDPLPDIGILDRSYPRGFWAQMWTPFRSLISGDDQRQHARPDSHS
ncbi:sterol desaturase family protein [Immundisolibacter sp.]|uniref:sterol desaturase family protein n=1 Tax=Immundisolibacter sp. TaxID=1934948 RepID=UPI0035676CB5